MLSLEGRQLGNYDVIRRIRVGGMGAVYEGKQRTAFGRRVAIKVILGDYAQDTDMRRRFAREARTIARLHHPHILPLIEFGDEGGLLFLVMPFIDGGTLTSFLRRSLPGLNEVSAMYQQLLDAVEYAHEEGLIHRDIKSSNVLLEQRRSGPPYAYLADFGLVRTLRQAEGDQSGQSIPLDQVPGTPHYMAPEQTRGIVTPLTDIYALGVLLYQMLTGELPYDDPDEIRVIQMHLQSPIPSPCDRDSTIPVELDEVVRTAMAKLPEDRYQNVAALREAFLRAVNGPLKGGVEPLLPVEEVFSESARSRRASVPLQPLELPAPAATERRLAKQTIALGEQGKRRVTESVRNKPQRITESMPGKRVKRKRKRRATPVLVATIVPLILLALLIVPRVLGISLFPVGFPVLGANPTATVTIIPQSKTLQNTYLLTASPQVTQPALAKRFIPDHTVSQTLLGTHGGQATGSVTIGGSRAVGTILLVNTQHQPVTVVAGMVFTSVTNVQVQTTASVLVPPRQQGENGTATVSAVALTEGVGGNIGANTINTKCCTSLSVSNPNGFSGGADARSVPVVTQADINRASSALIAQMERQALQQLLQGLAPGEVLTGLPSYKTHVTSDHPAGAEVSQFSVQAQVSATALAYNRADADQLAGQLLSQQATQQLGGNFHLLGTLSTDVPRIVQQNANGVAYLSITVHGAWRYHFSAQQMNHWRLSLKGLPRENALAYLNEQTGVSAVQLQLPFGTDHLPATTNLIQIVLMNS
ncbi:MAG: protein kinase [Ktedonobacteraceae bacterium]